MRGNSGKKYKNWSKRSETSQKVVNQFRSAKILNLGNFRSAKISNLGNFVGCEILQVAKIS